MKRFCVLTVVCLLCVRAVCADAPLIERDVSWAPIYLRHHEKVYTWTERIGGRDVRNFLAPNGIEIRQGEVRISAPAAYLQFLETESRRERQALLLLYAEGKMTHEGGFERIRLVEGDQVRNGMYMLLPMKSYNGLRWDESVIELEEPPKFPLADRAANLMKEYHEKKLIREFLSNTPPEVPKSRWSFDIPVLMFEQSQIFEDPENPELLVLVLMGDVRVVYRDMILEATNAVLWMNKERYRQLGPGAAVEVYAEGFVRLRRKTGEKGEVIPPGAVPGEVQQSLGFAEQVKTLTADKVYVKPSEWRGVMKDAELRIKEKGTEGELVVRGEEVYMLDRYNTLIKRGILTDNPYARPNYYIQTRKVRLVQREGSVAVRSWGVTGRVRDVPVMYFPYLASDVREPSFLISGAEVGSSNRFGTFGRLDVNLRDAGVDPPWLKNFTLHADYYSKRGPAGGVTAEYMFGKRNHYHEGEFFGYYVHDEADTDISGGSIPDENRAWVDLQHRWQINREWRIDAEVSYLRDAGFLEEYFEEEFEEGKPQETLLFARYRDGHLWSGIVAKKQVNNFYSQIEELPSGTVHVVNKPLLGGYVQYRTETSGGYYDLEKGDPIAQPAQAGTAEFFAQPDPQGVGRFHTRHAFDIPFSLLGVHFVPSMGALATAVTRGADEVGDTTDDPEARLGLGLGLNVSTVFHRIFPLKAPRLGLDRLRHLIRPEIRLNWIPAVSKGSRNFVQMDHVDAIDESHELRAGLRQRLQTKREGRPVDYIVLDTFYVNRHTESISNIYQERAQRFRIPQPDEFRNEEYLEIDLLWQITDHIAFLSKDNRLAISDGPDHFNGGIYLNYSPKWNFFVGLRRVVGHSTSLTLDFSVDLGGKYRFLLFEKYNLKSPVGGGQDYNNLETRIAIQRLFHNWLVEAAFTRDEADSDTSFMIYFKRATRTFVSQRY